MTVIAGAAALCAAAAVWSLLLPSGSALRLRSLVGSGRETDSPGDHASAKRARKRPRASRHETDLHCDDALPERAQALAGLGRRTDPNRDHASAKRAGAPARSSRRGPGPHRDHALAERAWKVASFVRSHVAFRRAGRRSESRWRAGVIALCDGVAAELAAGRAQETALALSIETLEPELAAVLLAEWAGDGGLRRDGVPRRGREVPEMLERVAARPGAQGLRLLAACWRIGSERGGGFASVVDGLAAALRDDEAHREEVMAQLAGPRATAKLLAGLPVLGLLMGVALGAHPLSFLFGTLPGLCALVLGVALDALGLFWTERLAANAEEPR